MGNTKNSAVPRYSRSEGVQAYRRRRRRTKTTRVVVALVLLCILGGAAFLFGRQYLDYSHLPFEVPGMELFNRPEPEIGPAPEVIPTIEPVQANFLFAGDVIMNRTVLENSTRDGGAYSFDHLFSHLTGELSQFDVRAVDQETALAGNSFGFGYSVPLNAPQELGRSEVQAGFNVILRATDHSLDTGSEGVHNEMVWWDSEFPQIPIVGMTEPDPEANPGLGGYVNDIYVYDKEGFRIAILNHTWGLDNREWFVSKLDEEKIAADVAKARELGANLIVACPHWGRENSFEISDEQRNFSRVYANLGVDVIVGTNPRVLQRVEVLQTAEGHKTLCFYSLGCLVSSLYPDNLVGGLAEVELMRDAEGNASIQSATLKPVVTHRASGDEYATYLARDYTNELAASSWDSGLTPDDIARRCREVLGEGYDAAAGELRIDLNATVPLE